MGQVNNEQETRPSVPSYDYSLFGEVEDVPLDNIRQIVGRRMTASWQNIPHVTHHEEVDITDLEKQRHTRNETAGAAGQKLSSLAFILKACVAGLKEFPDVNSSLGFSGKTLHLKRYYNIAMAVDTPAGLIVPVLKGVDKMDIPAIAEVGAKLAEKARSGKLGFADTEGEHSQSPALVKLAGQRSHPS